MRKSLVLGIVFIIAQLAYSVRADTMRYTPPDRIGTIYIVSKFKPYRAGNVFNHNTKITVTWGGFNRSESYDTGLRIRAGFVVKLYHQDRDQIELVVDSEGEIGVVKQLREPPSEWSDEKYQHHDWSKMFVNRSQPIGDLVAVTNDSPSKTPLILIHGIHGTEPFEDVLELNGYWTSFLTHLDGQPLVRDRYAIYAFQYYSDRKDGTVEHIAGHLARLIDQKLPSRRLVIVAHSMGGLVAKSYMVEHRGVSKVKKLITLATPHRGTPGANAYDGLKPYTERMWGSAVNEGLKAYWGNHAAGAECDIKIDSECPNRRDMKWDNHLSPSVQENRWLKSLNENLSRVHSQIIAYAGFLGDGQWSRTQAVGEVLSWWDTLSDNEKLQLSADVIYHGLGQKFGRTDGMVPFKSGLLCSANSSNYLNEPNGFCDSSVPVRRFEPGTTGEVPISGLPDGAKSITRSSSKGRGYDHLDMYTHPDVLKWLVCDLGGPCPKQPGGNPPPDEPPVSISAVPTLFLFDVSGSMNENNKIESARRAGLDALTEMREGGAERVPISVMEFSGDNCGGNNLARTLMPFQVGIGLAEQKVMALGRPPNGGTPIPQARDAAIARMNAFFGANSSVKEGRIILLSDGQSTCGPEIRPAGVFTRQDIRVMRPSPITFLTIGFDVPAGSKAERDLQYMAATTGGRYYNAADRDGLVRALRKHVRVYRPRACNMANADFVAGIKGFAERDYPTALESFRRYVGQNPGDWCGQYNLALALEANDRYKRAGEGYARYLSLMPSSPDRTRVEAKVAEMRTEYAAFLDYQIRLIQSDHDYLRGPFWRSIFNNESSEVAAEFGSFVYEKGEFYANLPDILEIDERWLMNDSKNISSSLRLLDGRRNQKGFDIDAVSLLTTPVGQIEDMLERLTNYRSVLK